jgi:hypothetical protein
MKNNKMQELILKDFIDSKGNAYINVILSNSKDLFSPYSDRKMLNHDIIRYLNDITDSIPNKYNLIIKFLVSNRKNIDQESVRLAIKRYYWLSYEEKRRNIFKQIFLNIILMVMGFISLLFGILFAGVETEFFFKFFIEFSFLVSWILLWESITNLFIGLKDKLKDRDDEKQLAMAKIIFRDKKKKKFNTNQEIKKENTTE